MLCRHGIRQLRTGWADGPAYITQCPIQPGQNYVYNFTITGQRGTLLWHAHILWLRATVHGALVILPKLGVPYPFPTPHKEAVVVLGENYYSSYLIMKNDDDENIMFFLFLIQGIKQHLIEFFAAEWWKSNVEAVINEAMKSGLAPNVSDAHTINGHPGPLSSCSLQGKSTSQT